MTGPDCTQFWVSGREADDWINEIEEYWNAWYHTSTEAIWCIMGYSVTKKMPSVTSLPIHHPNAIHNRRYVTRRGTGSLSTLERYFFRPDGSFNVNGSVRNFSDLQYSEYFQLFRLQSYDPIQAIKHPEWLLE